MLRTAAVLWLGALVATTSLLVLVVSAQQGARWARGRRRSAAARPGPETAVVPAQRVRPTAPEHAAV